MLIDWFTIIAQIINFVVLLLLLRRFLYRPILNAMQERERKVAERLESAKQERVHAEEERARYESLNEELRQHTEQKKHEAEEEVAAWRKENLQQARQDVDNAKQSWQKAKHGDGNEAEGLVHTHDQKRLRVLCVRFLCTGKRLPE